MKKQYIKPTVAAYEFIGRESLMFTASPHNVYEVEMDGSECLSNGKHFDDDIDWDE